MGGKKKKKPPQGSYTDFPVLLRVDEDGTAHWLNGASSYEEAIGVVSQKQNYCMQANREQEARKQFDVYVSKSLKQENKKLNLIELEAKFGERARLMSKDGKTVAAIADALGLSEREVKIIVKEVR